MQVAVRDPYRYQSLRRFASDPKEVIGDEDSLCEGAGNDRVWSLREYLNGLERERLNISCINIPHA